MKNNKLLILILLLVLAGSIISGCSSSSENTANKEMVTIKGQINLISSESAGSLNNDSQFFGVVKDASDDKIILDNIEVNENNEFSIQVEKSKEIIIYFTRVSDNIYLSTYIPETKKDIETELTDITPASTIVSIMLEENNTENNKVLSSEEIVNLVNEADKITNSKTINEFIAMINIDNLNLENRSCFSEEALIEIKKLKDMYLNILRRHIISGHVYDKNGNPLENIEIVNSNNKLLAKSDSEGKWEFKIDSQTENKIVINPKDKEMNYYFEPTDYYKVKYTFNESEKHEIDTKEISNNDLAFYSNELSHKSYNLQDKLKVNMEYEKEVSHLYDSVKKPVYWISANQLGKPNNTKQELIKLQGQPDKLRKEIDNLYEALMYIGTIPDEELKDNEVTYIESYPQDEWGWGIDQPTELAIEESKIYGCRPISNVADYLLSDDYEEVGLVFMRNIGDGHSINYIREDDMYYFFYAGNAFHNGAGLAHDTGIVEKNYPHHHYIIKTKYPDQFVKFYANSDQEEDYVFFALYDFDTNPLHIGSKGGSGTFGFPIANDGSNARVYIDQNNQKEYGFIEAPSNPSTKAPIVEKYSSYDSFRLFFEESNNIKNEAPEEIIISMD